MIFGKRTQRERQNRKNRQRKERRSKFRSEISRQLIHESLEARQLLAVLNVNTFDDVVNAADNATVLSLREAIDIANSNNENDTINLPAGTYAMSIAGTGEDLNVTGDYDITADGGNTVTINGAGANLTIIDGLQKDRVFHVLPGADASFTNLTITGGLAQSPGGGILNEDGAVTLTSSIVTGNRTSTNGAGPHSGGGIANIASGGSYTYNDDPNSPGYGYFDVLTPAGTASLTITDSTVSGNTANEDGGGIANIAGGGTGFNDYDYIRCPGWYGDGADYRQHDLRKPGER